MMSAAASLGVVLLWDVEMGLTQIDKYLYSNEEHIKVSFHISFSCKFLNFCSLNYFLHPNLLT